MEIFDYLSNKSKLFITSLGIFISLLLGIIDYSTGHDFSPLIFYLIPILFVAWFAGRRFSVIIAVICLSALLVDEIQIDGTGVHFLMLLWNSIWRAGFFAIAIYLLTSLHNALTRERKLARIDPLTGIINIRHFYELATLEIQRALRFNHPITMAFIDIDDFKKINDTLGHGEGNNFLRLITDTIKNNIRAIDIFARVGGDEFVILMPETNQEQAKIAVNKLQQIIYDVTEKKGYLTTLSIGVATYFKPQVTANEMLNKADNLMYYAKVSGKNMAKYEIVNSSNNNILT